MSLKEKVSAGKFVILGEFQTPKGADFSALLREAEPVKGRLDAILVPDQAMAVLKASALGGCAFLQSRGFETVMQMCPRDRNRLALQADLLSAAALGVPNLLVAPGDDVTHGDHHLAREVHDLDVTALLEVIQGLAGGKDMSGIPLSAAANFFPGVEMVTGAAESILDSEIEKLHQRLDLGIRFVVTSPIFDPRSLAGLMDRIDTGRVAVIPSVMVLKSAGMARYVDRNVRHVTVPADMIRRVEKAPDRERIGLRIAAEIVIQLKEMGLAGAVIQTRGWRNACPAYWTMRDFNRRHE